MMMDYTILIVWAVVLLLYLLVMTIAVYIARARRYKHMDVLSETLKEVTAECERLARIRDSLEEALASKDSEGEKQ